MEWYNVVAIIIAFFCMVALVCILHKRGVLDSKLITAISQVIDAVANYVSYLAEKHDGAIDIIDSVLKLVDTAVKSAENDWINGKIEKEERHAQCIKKLQELLDAYEITLTEVQWDVIETLIAAACENMGHPQEKLDALNSKE